ncbi:PQQ-binding-like beta-propeller repeat protein [Halorussus litoreus]|uniref:PQQ-binding-like beta-propeller repeat protein n=1 Tax=Halorussus litoreus TaxID=1710536 RepID=UPI001E459C04|nr:PQQ-binding-like beta-propeller repeat protein [Halorussus litoreus]
MFDSLAIAEIIAPLDRWESLSPRQVEYLLMQHGSQPVVVIEGDIDRTAVRSEAEDRSQGDEGLEPIGVDSEEFETYRTGLSGTDSVIALGEQTLVLGTTRSAVRRTLNAKLGERERYHESSDELRDVLSKTVTSIDAVPDYAPSVRDAPIRWVWPARDRYTFEAAVGNAEAFYYFLGFDERYQGSDDEKRQQTTERLESAHTSPLSVEKPVLNGSTVRVRALIAAGLRRAANGDWHLGIDVRQTDSEKRQSFPRTAGFERHPDGDLLVKTFDSVHKVDPESGTFSWTYDPPFYPVAIQPAEDGHVLVDGRPAVSGPDYNFSVLNGTNGEDLTTDTGIDNSIRHPGRVADGTVYGTRWNDHRAKLRATPISGSRSDRWEFDAPNDSSLTVLAATPDVVAVWERSLPRNVYLLDAASGSVLREWSYEEVFGGKNRSGVVPLKTDTHVFINKFDGGKSPFGYGPLWGIPLSPDGEDAYLPLEGALPEAFSAVASEPFDSVRIDSHVLGQRRYQTFHDGRIFAVTGDVWREGGYFEILVPDSPSSSEMQTTRELLVEFDHPLTTLPAVTDSHVYFQDTSGLYAVARDSGERVWESADVPRLQDVYSAGSGRLSLLGETGVYSLTNPTTEIGLPFEQLMVPGM